MVFIIADTRSSSGRSHTSSISTAQMESILEGLKTKQHRSSTMKNYHTIWRTFNSFVIKLDKKPRIWEDRVALFGAYLVNKGIQSSTLKSYISAIKAVLLNDGYPWEDNKIILSTLVKACKLENDRVKTRLPIQMGLLEIILFEVQRLFADQPYLETLYKAIFLAAYYGMFRVGELVTGSHPIRAKDVHIGKNKNKMLFILYTSKTHGLDAKPQKIKITEVQKGLNNAKNIKKRFFCPFRAAREYLAIRGNYKCDSDPFFVFKDNQPVTPGQVRKVLRTTLKSVDLDPMLYNVQSMRIGRATDMFLKFNYSLPQVKSAGRWKSNAVFKYIRSFEF